jgi:hypothetical protein
MGLWLLVCGLLFRWMPAAGGVFVIVWLIRSYMMSLRADSHGLIVTNRFWRYRIPWEDVDAIRAPSGIIGRYGVALTLAIERKRRFFTVPVNATLGLRLADRERVAHDLAEVAKNHGYDVAGGSERQYERESAEQHESSSLWDRPTPPPGS